MKKYILLTATLFCCTSFSMKPKRSTNAQKSNIQTEYEILEKQFLAIKEKNEKTERILALLTRIISQLKSEIDLLSESDVAERHDLIIQIIENKLNSIITG